ncbi:hypothetical protein D3C87_1827080 [compost metagenome]
MVIHLHDHLALLAVDHELIGTRDTWAVEQRVDGKGGVVRFDGFKPERSEIWELFRCVGKGIDRQTTRGQSVLIGIINRAEVTRTEERHDVASRQFRCFKRAETRKT